MQTGSTAISRESYDARALVMDLLALLGFSAAILVARGFLRLHLGIPGHAAVIWMPILVLAGVRRSGMSFGSALIGGSMAVGFARMDVMDMGVLLLASSVVEAFGLSRDLKHRGAFMLFAGMLGHLAKLGLKVLVCFVAGVPLNRAGLTLYPTLALYAAFGLMGGAIAVGILAGWTRLRKKETPETNPTTG
jgi:hypothetical protein